MCKHNVQDSHSAVMETHNTLQGNIPNLFSDLKSFNEITGIAVYFILNPVSGLIT